MMQRDACFRVLARHVTDEIVISTFSSAVVTRHTRFINKLPSPCRQMTRRSGRPSATPKAWEESNPIAPTEK